MRLPLLLILSSLAVLIAGFEFINLRALDRDRPAVALERVQSTLPWGGLAGREAARSLETRWRADPELSAAALDWQLARYPMHPQRWLLRARIAHALDEDLALLGAHMSSAVAVQPGSRDVRWQSANLAQRTGDVDLVVDHLRLWLADQPNMADRALFVAQRWIDDPDVLIDRVLPPGDDFLARAMRYARSSRQPALAEAAWVRLDHPRQPSETLVADYMHTVRAAGDSDRLFAIWQDLDPRFRPGQVPAGHFGMELDDLPAFGWNLRMPAGASIRRAEGDELFERALRATNGETATQDFDHALVLSFSGEENLRLSTPLIRFPIPRAGHYRLTGWWRADDLTTRSLPYLHLRAENEGFRHTEHLPASDFGWQRLDVPFTLDEPEDSFRIQVLRRSTDAFDRYIEGRLWLADLAIEAGEAPPEAED
jgi:hypothetical protein